MTVAELVEKLKAFPGEMPVSFWQDYNPDFPGKVRVQQETAYPDENGDYWATSFSWTGEATQIVVLGVGNGD